MRTPFTQLYLHFVWATWDRHPFLSEPLRSRVYACIQAECGRLGADVIALGGVEDHVHVLVRVPATIAPAELVNQMKGVSSHLVNHEIRPPFFFKWQGGYGAFTITKRDVPAVRDYVNNQERHHREKRLDPAVEPSDPVAPR
ncbi:MAG TPA: IS200/IS605 family transposase [Longimicrobiaceae bacterium]|nr:IS200/IS605 family transposase [Longimicrobiaceae bacterium]